MKPTPSNLLLILVLGLLLAVVVDLKPPKAKRASKNFDFFILAQTWPVSFYKIDRNATKTESDFRIHGFWPNNGDGSHPIDCNLTSSFEESAVSKLMPIMNKYWPKLSSHFSSNQEFWSFEWKKHGTCSESNLNQHYYFETALNLSMSNDLLKILKTQGINPNGQNYTIFSIKRAIKDETGYTPIINCKKPKNSSEEYLYEIWRCVRKAGPGYPEIEADKPKFFDCLEFPATKLLEKEKKKCGGDDEKINFPSFEEMTSGNNFHPNKKRKTSGNDGEL